MKIDKKKKKGRGRFRGEICKWRGCSALVAMVTTVMCVCVINGVRRVIAVLLLGFTGTLLYLSAVSFLRAPYATLLLLLLIIVSSVQRSAAAPVTLRGLYNNGMCRVYTVVAGCSNTVVVIAQELFFIYGGRGDRGWRVAAKHLRLMYFYFIWCVMRKKKSSHQYAIRLNVKKYSNYYIINVKPVLNNIREIYMCIRRIIIIMSLIVTCINTKIWLLDDETD